MNVRKDLLANVYKTPQEWDGIELRQWIADRFQGSVFHNILSGKRKRDYKNAVLVNNLD